MTFDEVLTEFRALGGVAENVRLGEGPVGRGVFVVDPSQPARLWCPDRLLLPVEQVDLRDGELVAKSDAPLGARERAFFDACMKSFGWGPNARNELWRAQEAWSTLPPAVVQAICTLGIPEDLETRFAAPTLDVCAVLYVRTRRATRKSRPHLMPLVDLVNHSGRAGAYITEGGVGVAGQFDGEMLVRYSIGDAWSTMFGYGFCDRPMIAHSVAVTLDAHGKRIAIGRDFSAWTYREGAVVPHVKSSGDAIDIAFLPLGQATPDLPRAVFRSIMRPHLAPAVADEVFDHVAHFNRMKALGLLRVLRGHSGPLIETIAEATMMQLETLSSCIGARDYGA